MKLNTVICGDCLEVLKTFPDESIDCCITSPPYWALRDYSTNPQIWDGDEKCKHEWNTRQFKQHSGRGDCQKSGKYSEQESIPDKNLSDSFCTKCGAWKGSFGLEPTFQLYIKHLCDIFDEVKRVLKKEGTCWVNMGDTYGGANSRASENGRAGYGMEREGVYSMGVDKCLCQIPSRFAIEMTNRGWILRNEIIWHKPNCMPSSAKDRFTVDFEKIFFFTKSKKYYFETQFENATRDWSKSGGNIMGKGIHKKGGKIIDNKDGRDISVPRYDRNKRAVWKIPTKPYSEAHFATYPPALIETPIKAGCPERGIVLDPFFGSGTSGLVAKNLNRNYIGIELNKEYIKIANRRLSQGVLQL